MSGEIGQVGEREQHGGDGDRGVLGGEKACEARHEIVVQQELLVEGPEDYPVTCLRSPL